MTAFVNKEIEWLENSERLSHAEGDLRDIARGFASFSEGLRTHPQDMEPGAIHLLPVMTVLPAKIRIYRELFERDATFKSELERLK
jgi:hypothetical protein